MMIIGSTILIIIIINYPLIHHIPSCTPGDRFTESHLPGQDRDTPQWIGRNQIEYNMKILFWVQVVHVYLYVRYSCILYNHIHGYIRIMYHKYVWLQLVLWLKCNEKEDTIRTRDAQNINVQQYSDLSSIKKRNTNGLIVLFHVYFNNLQVPHTSGNFGVDSPTKVTWKWFSITSQQFNSPIDDIWPWQVLHILLKAYGCKLGWDISVNHEQVPSRQLTYPTFGKGKSEKHLQNAIFGGYVSSLEGI